MDHNKINEIYDLILPLKYTINNINNWKIVSDQTKCIVASHSWDGIVYIINTNETRNRLVIWCGKCKQEIKFYVTEDKLKQFVTSSIKNGIDINVSHLRERCENIVLDRALMS